MYSTGGNDESRDFLCITDLAFPQENALSNYIENFCMLLRKTYKNASITIAAKKNTCDIDEPERYDEFTIVRTNTRKDGAVRNSELRKVLFSVNNNCLIFMFSSKVSSVVTILSAARIRGIRVVAFYGEWFDRGYYPYGIRGSIHYRGVDFNFRHIRPLAGNAIVISRYIEEYLVSKGVYVQRIPPLTDINRVTPFQERGRFNNSINRFIYSGGDYKKDRIDNIVHAFAMLDDRLLNKVELHFCGIRKEVLMRMVDIDTIKRVDGRLIIHPWLRTNEYYALLETMDYCIVLRDNNQITKANFPSKIPEVMSRGIVPVVTDIGDYTELYLEDRKDSLFVNGSTPTECRDAIIEAIMLSDEALLEMKKEAVKTASDKFDISNWTEIIKDYIQGIK